MVAILIGMCLCAGLAAFHQSTFAAKQQKATLTGVKGKVAVQAKGTSTWKTATNNMDVNAGDMVRTSSGSSAIIKFSDGSMVKQGPMASMTIGALDGTAGNAKTKLDVDSGKTWARVRKVGADSSFDVETPTAVAGVRGTFFSSEAEEDASTFDVFDGQVMVSSSADPSQSVAVNAHERTTVAENKAPAAPSQIPAAEENEGRGGFSEEEYTSATFEIQVSVSPQVVKPGESATLSVQVFKNGEPYSKEVSLNLVLGGSATFMDSGSNTMSTTTNTSGGATLQITDSVEESINVDASMTIKVKK
jgi:hypothetical protein